MRTRVLLADDRAPVRSALRLLLEQELGAHVVGEVDEATPLVDQVEAVHPNVILLDWELPGLPAADLLAGLRTHCPHLVIVALSGRPEARREALAAGCDAFVSKGDPPERLLALLRRVAEGGDE